MSQDHSRFHAARKAGDDLRINPSSNPPLAELLDPGRTACSRAVWAWLRWAFSAGA